MRIFTDRLEYWRFIQSVEYDIRITKNKEIWSKNELIAKFKPKKKMKEEKLGQEGL